MYHEDIFYPFLPMFSTFDGKMVNVVENAECFSSRVEAKSLHLKYDHFYTMFPNYCEKYCGEISLTR